MATWFPIGGGALSQRILASGLPASGYVLKCYTAGTSTNIPLATDSTGNTQANYAVANATGDWTVSGNVIIPHINADFKLCIYPTQAAADADSGATVSIDNIALATIHVTLGTFGATTVGSSYVTLANPSAITFPRMNANNTVTALTADAMLTALGLTTAGKALATLANPSAITFPRINADNTVTALSASAARTALGATTVGDAVFTAANPGAITYFRANADNTVTLISAATLVSELGILDNTAASQAEMESASSTGVMVTPGRTQFHPGVAKAWLMCNAAGAVAASHNITSITDDGVGLVTVTIATDFSSANYAIIPGALSGTTDSDTIRVVSGSQAAGSFQLRYGSSGTTTDPTAFYVACFGDQA